MKHVAGYTNSARFRCLEDLQKDSADLCLIYCGWEYCNPGHKYGPNLRTSYVLHIVRSGKGILEINKHKYELKEGDAFFIAPEVEAWYEADKKDPWCYMWVGFTGYRAEENAEHAGFSRRNPIRHVECKEQLNQYLDGILAAHQHSYPGVVYVRHAMEYISHHYQEKVKINELADYIGVNRSYLTSSFKKAVGCSPQEYLVNLRMEKAKNLLKNTDMPINAVAAAVGYQDQLAFSKIFKQNFTVSPKEYRKAKEELQLGTVKGDFTASHL